MAQHELIIALIAALSLAFYSFHILVFTSGWVRMKKRKREGDFTPGTSVTIVVAARNEQDTIVRLLEDLGRQRYPRELTEVLIIDDHSGDGTADVAERYIREYRLDSFHVIVLQDLGIVGSKKKAIEAGVARAKGELIAVTDADCRIGERWLGSLVREFETNGAVMLSGPVMLNSPGTLAGTFQEMEYMSLAGSGAGAIGAGKAVLCSGANMAFSKEAFEAVGGYAGNLQFASGDDVFLLHKMKRHFGSSKISFVKDPDAIVTTDAEPGWRGFLRQRIRWASKTRGYRDLFSVTTALSVFLIHLVQLVLLLTGFFYPVCLLLFVLLFLLKMMVDLPIMAGVTSFFGKRRLMFWFVPFEVIYFIYVILAGAGSLLYTGTWKGRRI